METQPVASNEVVAARMAQWLRLSDCRRLGRAAKELRRVDSRPGLGGRADVHGDDYDHTEYWDMSCESIDIISADIDCF